MSVDCHNASLNDVKIVKQSFETHLELEISQIIYNSVCIL